MNQLKTSALILRITAITLLSTFTGACISVDYPVETVEQARLGKLVTDDPEIVRHLKKIADLEQVLLSLGPDVDPMEAANVAGSTVEYALVLAEEYELTTQPVLHNVFVNKGWRPRGLCVHFAEDILRMLLTKNLQTYDVYWGVAYPTKLFRLEHSSVVITAKGKPFESGVLLDGWRNSGELFYSFVTEDDRYNWELFDDKVTQEFRERRAGQNTETQEAE